MNSPGTFQTDALILEKIRNGQWIAEPSTGKVYSREIGGFLTGHGNVRRSQAKISFEDADEIRRKYAEGGITQQTLADMYHIDSTVVSRILTGKRHVRPNQIPYIKEETKANIFNDICCKGHSVHAVRDRYHVSQSTIIAALEEQSLKIEISKKVNN